MRISDWSSDVCSSDLVYKSVATISNGGADRQYAAFDRRTALSGPRERHGVDLVAIVSIVQRLGAPTLGKLRTIAGIHLRSDERRVGKECVRTCRFRWSLYPSQQQSK